LHDATFLYLPEIDEPELLAKLELGKLLSPERVERREQALEYAARELRAMLEHFNGDCTWCEHGELPATHSKVGCPAQIAALAKQIDGIIADLPAILTPFGPLHVNDLEVNSIPLHFLHHNL